MNPLELDSNVLAEAIGAWERDREAYGAAPFECLAASYPMEASYLYQLARGYRAPAGGDPVLAHLLQWKLVDRHARLTPLGRRLLAASGNRREASRIGFGGSAPGARVRLTERALYLVNEIAAGRDRIFAMDDRPPGWLALERLGLASRVVRGALERAVLTPAGEKFASGLVAGKREALDDAWTREQAQAYLAEIGAPISDFDAGHQAGVRLVVGLWQAPLGVA